MRFKTIRIAAMVGLVLAVTGCSLVGPSAGSLSPTVTPAAPAGGLLTPTLPAATQARPPGAATQTPLPPPQGSGAATRVEFGPGATQTVLTGSLAAHGTARYVLGVAAGQLVDVSFGTQAQPTITLSGADGKLVPNALSSATTFRGVVPSSGDYTLQLTGGDQPVTFSMSVLIPQRISFAAGATEAILGGSLDGTNPHYYVIHLSAGQLALISFSNADSLHTSMYGVDGTVMQSGMGNGAGLRAIIPVSEDYVLQVQSSGPAVDYAVTVDVPERVSFAPNATTVTLTRTLAGRTSYLYVVNVQAGQILDVTSLGPETDINLAIFGVDGTELKSGASGPTAFRGKVPTTQDYILSLMTGSQAVDEALNVTIPQRITFAPGATSATLSGSLAAHEAHTFSVEAAQGQTLDVAFTPEGSAKMSIYGLDGDVLWSGMGEGTHFNGKLPSTQAYFIVFQAADSPVQFKLVVTIQ